MYAHKEKHKEGQSRCFGVVKAKHTQKAAAAQCRGQDDDREYPQFLHYSFAMLDKLVFHPVCLEGRHPGG